MYVKNVIDSETYRVKASFLCAEHLYFSSWTSLLLFLLDRRFSVSDNWLVLELLEGLKEMFPLYYMGSDVISKLKSHTCACPITKGLIVSFIASFFTNSMSICFIDRNFYVDFQQELFIFLFPQNCNIQFWKSWRNVIVSFVLSEIVLLNKCLKLIFIIFSLVCLYKLLYLSRLFYISIL